MYKYIRLFFVPVVCNMFLFSDSKLDIEIGRFRHKLNMYKYIRSFFVLVACNNIEIERFRY